MIYPSLNNKVALVTGGTRGIGRRVAELMAMSGCHLCLSYKKDREEAEATEKMLKKYPVSVDTFQSDVMNEGEISDLIAAINSSYRRLDFLVSNAVFGILKPVGQFTGKRFDVAMDANARAYLLLAQAAADLMSPIGAVKKDREDLPKPRKRIVALSSLGSQHHLPGYAAVGASKAAIESLTRYMAVEMAPRGIGVNAVSGGLINTRSIQAFIKKKSWVKDQIKRTPFKRIGQTDDIAKVVVWLLSDQSEWITGQTIVADGGFSLT